MDVDVHDEIDKGRKEGNGTKSPVGRTVGGKKVMGGLSALSYYKLYIKLFFLANDSDSRT